jgi:ABC-2 type transport system ATP-binding protein
MTESPNGQPVVRTEQLTKKYGDFVALDALTMELHAGQILGFIGPNGAGKTTTIKILVGLSQPTSGQAFVCGMDCTRNAQRLKQSVGYMPDTFGSYDNMRVREYLDFFGAAFRIPRKQRIKRVEEVMDIAGATYMKDRYVESLSHGMKQRVGVSRALLHDPPVLILDEPANGLDPQARIEMRQLLLRLSQMGKTLIVTSHILPELSRVCNVVAIITQGKLRAFGTLDQIMQQVAQRRIIEIEVLNEADVNRAAQLLTANLEPDAEIRPSPQERQIRFVTEADNERLSGIVRYAVQEDISVVEFHEVPLDLEDAFLEVTGLRDKQTAIGDREAKA